MVRSNAADRNRIVSNRCLLRILRYLNIADCFCQRCFIWSFHAVLTLDSLSHAPVKGDLVVLTFGFGAVAVVSLEHQASSAGDLEVANTA